ncbi:MAG: ATPase [Bacteroides sp.]|nr:hypothetical protein [Eubacterium sp.]MCM1419032.1 hypothetical protein [Roseburia sp.]MCM1463553.1 ATPase [Bacteroides sp.]
MKTYTIIAGVNGVGKSSLTGVLIGEGIDLGEIVDTDKLAASLGGDKLAGGKEAVRRIRACLGRGESFTQETTLSGAKTLKTILAARERGYYIRLYYIGVDTVGESLRRIKNRVEKGGHDIPERDVKRRYDKRFRDLAAVLPFCDEVKLYDNENGFAERAEIRDQALFWKERPVGWLAELERYLAEPRKGR